MGITHSTAKILAPTAFLFNFAAQQYGIFSTPSMKDINDRNTSFFSPHPFSIAAFFTMQQFFQIGYIYKLITLDPKASGQSARDLHGVLDYAPYFSLGNLCIGSWMFFWNNERLDISNVFVIINSISQLYYVFGRQPSFPLQKGNWASMLTHLTSKTFAGIGVLDLLHNGSVAYFKDQKAGLAIKVLTGLGFAVGSAASDWIFGGSLVWDLLGLSVGQYTLGRDVGWSYLLGSYAVGAAAIVVGKNLARPPYEGKQGYQVTEPDVLNDDARV